MPPSTSAPTDGSGTACGANDPLLESSTVPPSAIFKLCKPLSELCVIIGLYALFTWRALRIGQRCVELRLPFQGYVAFGIGLWISLQALVSMGVNMGILPTKGLTLPLISSGGSSVLMTCAAFGMLLRISYELERAERRQAARTRGDAVQAGADDEPELPMHNGATVAQRPSAMLAVSRTGGRARIEPRFGAQR